MLLTIKITERREQEIPPYTQQNYLPRGGGSDCIAFLDDDDEWLPEKLEKQLTKLQECGDDTGLVYCGGFSVYRDTNTGNEYMKRGKLLLLEGYVYDKMILGDFIGSFSIPLIRTKYLVEIGGMDERLPNRQDWDTWLRLSKICKFTYVNAPLFVYHYEETTQHVSTSNVARTAVSLDIIESKNIDYLRENKDAYYSFQCRKVRTYGIIGDYRKLFASWRKAVKLKPKSVASNISLIISSLFSKVRLSLWFRKRFYPLFIRLKKLKYSFTRERIK